MEKYRIKNSILAINNQLLPVNVATWGSLTLAPADKVSFLKAHADVLSAMANAGIVTTQITETFNNQTLFVGEEIVFPNLQEFQNTNEYLIWYGWVEQMRNDPNIQIFNWLEKID